MYRPVANVVHPDCSRSLMSTVPCNNSMDMLLERLLFIGNSQTSNTYPE